MHERFEKRIEEGLEKIVASCESEATAGSCGAARGATNWARTPERQERLKSRSIQIQMVLRSATGKESIAGGMGALSEGCYVLRSNVTDWSPEELWRAYMQLNGGRGRVPHSEDGSANSDHLAPETRERVEAHILVCFLAFVLWKTLAQLCQRAGWATNRGKYSRVGGHHPGSTWCYRREAE